MNPPPQLQQHRDGDLSPEQEQSIQTLLRLVWPPYPEGSPEASARAQRHAAPRPDRIRFVLWANGRAYAHAETFTREIHAEGGSRKVLALAAVCADPALRGRGYGASVVDAAFAEVRSGAYAVSLFQTGVPHFYERLGARQVDNPFVNRQDSENPEANPWWESTIMIYPAYAPWPTGLIDLNGPAY